MQWGQYLARGISSDPWILPTPTTSYRDHSEKIIALVEKYFQQEGATIFSSKIAVGYLQVKLSTCPEKMNHVMSFLLSNLNQTEQSCHPLQLGCPNIIPGLRTQPFWDTSQFSWVKDLEGSFQIILDEFLGMKEQGMLFQPYRSPRSGSVDRISDEIGELATNPDGNWNVCYLYLHGMDACFERNRAHCPHTTEIISHIPRHYHHAFFSAITGQTHIQPHHGPTNKKLRCQFPLVVPGSQICTLTAGGITQPLEEGKCLIFDDSFVHEAKNDSAEPRIILIFDVWHPDLSDEEVKFLTFLENAKMKVIRKYIQSDKVSQEDNFASIILDAQKREVNGAEIWGMK